MLMDKFRNASNGIVWKIVFALISLSFILSGIGGYVVSRVDTSAVKVNGEEISQSLFQQQYNNLYNQESQIQGSKFDLLADSEDYVKGLRNQVLERLVNQELLRQYTEELKLSISDAQITQEIVLNPNFQAEGKFDNNIYQQFLRNNNLTAETYAEYLREALALQQLQVGLADSEFVVPHQQKAFETLFFQQRYARLAHVPFEQYIAEQKVTEEEIKAYYEQHKAEFMMPELAKLQYIDLTQESVVKNTVVSDVEISQYYQDNKAQFMTKAQQQLAHIQFASEKEAIEAYQALQAGENFAKLAKNKSTDSLSATNGGDLGWVNAGDLPSEFEDAANALTPEQYSQPLKVDNNYHIIKVLARKESEVLALEKVKDQIAQQIRQELLNSEFYRVEKQVAEKAFEDQGSLETAAAASGLKIQETDYFSKDNIPAVLNHPAIIKAAFDESKISLNSEPMNIGEQHSIVIRLLDYKEAKTKALDEVKADIELMLKHQKAEKVAFEKAENIVKGLESEGKSPAGVTFSEVKGWSYTQQEQDALLLNLIFAMPLKENKTTYQVVKDTKGQIVIVALERIEQRIPSEQESAVLNSQVLQVKQQDLSLNLLKALRAKAKIEVNESFMNETE
ncbi:MAG: peptidylprolyl isomerase [Lonepinella koalarum]|nr:peptidylprolyl isomerase [Lonepinella koalarum]